MCCSVRWSEREIRYRRGASTIDVDSIANIGIQWSFLCNTKLRTTNSNTFSAEKKGSFRRRAGFSPLDILFFNDLNFFFSSKSSPFSG